jgi:4-hydroxythreonine-4-phosphate dehydrogenase
MAARTDNAATIAITCGDPNGIGPEVIAGALALATAKAQWVLIGPACWTRPLVETFGCKSIEVGAADFSITPGAPNKTGAEIARLALETAAQGCRNGTFDAVATAPISKEWMRKVGFDWPGQTEFFATRWGGEPTMGFVGSQLRVVLASWHIPLRAVADSLNPTLLERAIRRAHELALRCGCRQPRIAVCGLNPHAGESGLLGNEEIDWIDPLLDKLRNDLPGLSPALPGDTVFRRQLNGEFDICVALYHDQGLAPLKLLEFDQAVNITLGLPWLRTSPDHGTGYTIAGQGKASCQSMLRAIELAHSFC